MLIWCSRNISSYYQCYELCWLIFLWKHVFFFQESLIKSNKQKKNRKLKRAGLIEIFCAMNNSIKLLKEKSYTDPKLLNGSVCVFVRENGGGWIEYACMCHKGGVEGRYLVLAIIKRHHVHYHHILDFRIQSCHCYFAAGKHTPEIKVHRKHTITISHHILEDCRCPLKRHY